MLLSFIVWVYFHPVRWGGGLQHQIAHSGAPKLLLNEKTKKIFFLKEELFHIGRHATMTHVVTAHNSVTDSSSSKHEGVFDSQCVQHSPSLLCAVLSFSTHHRAEPKRWVESTSVFLEFFSSHSKMIGVVGELISQCLSRNIGHLLPIFLLWGTVVNRSSFTCLCETLAADCSVILQLTALL